MSNELITLQNQVAKLYDQRMFEEITALLTDDILEKYRDAKLYAWQSAACYSLATPAGKILEYAQKAIDADDKYYMGYWARGNAWHEKKEYDKAIVDYTKAIELNPAYADAYRSRANSLAAEGLNDKAIADYTKLIELNPDDTDGYNNRGNSWHEKGEYDKAIADYSRAIEIDPGYMNAYYNRGNDWKNKGENEKAIADYTKAIDLSPDYAAAYNNRGNAWKAIGDAKKAMDDYTRAIEIDPDYILAYNNRGNTWYDQNEFDKAIADFTHAIQLSPTYSDAYNNRGNAWFNKGEFDKAMEDYDKNIELNPHNALAYYNRGNTWNAKNNPEKAIADFTKAIELDPQYASAFNNRGYTWYNLTEYQKALDDYNKAIELNPQYADAYNNRGNAWKVLGEGDKAMEDYNKAIEVNLRYVSSYYNRGNVWYDKGEYDKAMDDYNKAIELDPTYSSAYNNRGNVWDFKGEYDKAIADYSKTIELNKSFAVAYYNRANSRKKSGKELEESISDFEKYLDLTPEKNDVWAIRARDFIRELQEKTKDNELKEISDLTAKIKKLLLITEGCITHYTGLTVTKKLVFDAETRFRISEGAFLNDTSEGSELFKFLEYQFTVRKDGLLAETFAPKPFIGSFVAENKYDDLNLWRFYGKENGVEAKGCALTIRMKEFIEAINLSATRGSTKRGSGNEDDINFYRVAYWDDDLSKINFQIPNSPRESEEELNRLMKELKDLVKNYNGEERSVLEKYLNGIAFLFKSDAYKNENELRLVIKGIEFDKKFDVDAVPPRVYIELINIRHLVEQITLGPKVDKPDEWASAFYYSYDKETDESRRPKKILISRLPYK